MTAANLGYTSDPIVLDRSGSPMAERLYLRDPSILFQSGYIKLDKGSVPPSHGELGRYKDIAYCATKVKGLGLEKAQQAKEAGWSRGHFIGKVISYKPEGLDKLKDRQKENIKKLKADAREQVGLTLFIAAKPLWMPRPDLSPRTRNKLKSEDKGSHVLFLAYDHGRKQKPKLMITEKSVDKTLPLEPIRGGEHKLIPQPRSELENVNISALEWLAEAFHQACVEKLKEKEMEEPSFRWNTNSGL